MGGWVGGWVRRPDNTRFETYNGLVTLFSDYDCLAMYDATLCRNQSMSQRS